MQFYVKAEIWELTGTKEEMIDSKVFYSVEVVRIELY
jgi:hypothetical protein